MTQYYDSLKQVCENALINMYLEVSERDRFTPTHIRSSMIKKFIKPKIKLPQYKLIKKELKRFSLARDSVSLEIEVQKLLDNLDKHKGKGDAEALLFDFLGNIHVWTGLMIQISTHSTVAEPGNIYLLKDETFTKLDNTGHYIEPINLHVYCDNKIDLDNAITKIRDDKRFKIAVSEQHDGHARLDVTPVT
ncbi:DUF2913 family protein [Shewanella algicola]|uniref:DUF2913 family protein n=1 Tax=Shewanella algicola TaxID=640633 RepID=UPI002494481A|nr:DUF2913 family protein [Shewanella algicola]